MNRSFPSLLILGDIIVLLLVTWTGFATHNVSLLNSRWLTTFIPLLAGWFLAATATELYQSYQSRSLVKVVWKAAAAAALAAPFGLWIRSLFLNSPVQPVFVLVMTGICVAALVGWHLIYHLWLLRKAKHG